MTTGRWLEVEPQALEPGDLVFFSWLRGVLLLDLVLGRHPSDRPDNNMYVVFGWTVPGSTLGVYRRHYHSNLYFVWRPSRHEGTNPL